MVMVGVIQEWKSGQYKKISDCPSYGAVKAYCDARNVLSKYYYDKAEYETPKDIISNERTWEDGKR